VSPRYPRVTAGCGRRRSKMKHKKNDNVVRRVRLNRRLPISGRDVKSSVRTLQIIEILDSLRSSLSCTSIASMLQAPTSSTDYILKTMASLGYIVYDREKRTYSLGHRVAPLGSWINPHLVSEGPVIRVMKEICDYVGENVALVTRNGLFSQVIHLVQPDRRDNPLVTVGTSTDILHSPAGHCLLSLLPDEDIQSLVRRYNANCELAESLVKPRRLLDVIQKVRWDGYDFSGNSEVGWGVALPLPEFSGEQIFSIVVGAFDSEISVDPRALLRCAKKAIAKHRNAPHGSKAMIEQTGGLRI
jgi:IclR family acetate operon transcriptional repressor